MEEALYRGLVKLSQLREPRAVGKWFCRILTNLWRDGWPRRGHRTSSLEDLSYDPTASDKESPEVLVAAKELGEKIVRAMASLPPLQRAVLTLHMEEGFSVAEIAEVLESTPGKVKISCGLLATMRALISRPFSNRSLSNTLIARTPSPRAVRIICVASV